MPALQQWSPLEVSHFPCRSHGIAQGKARWLSVPSSLGGWAQLYLLKTPHN